MTMCCGNGREAAARVLSLVLAAFLAVMLVPGAPRAQAGECVVSGVVERPADSFAAASRDGSAAAFAAALARHASIGRLALFALGPYRKRISSAETGEYVRLTGKFVGRMLAFYASDIVRGRLVIDACYRNSGATMVRSRLGATPVLWRVKGHRISDVKVDGIWLAVQLRSTFVSVLRRAGGDLDALFAYLQRS